MVTIPITVSDELAGRLRPFQDRLPEIIELGLHHIQAQTNAHDAETDSLVSKARVLAALHSTGIVTLPDIAAHLQPRTRHTPIQADGQPASEIIIQARGVL
jgi:hypothetical protein